MNGMYSDTSNFGSRELEPNSNTLFNISGNNTETDVLYDVPVEIIVILSTFYGTISLLAVIGNTLIIWIVASTRQMHTVTNLFIANLALADVVIGMFVIPFQFQAALLQRWNLPGFMCAFCPFVQTVSVNVSVFTLTAIAVDRHRAIITPLRARPPKYISKIIITTIWIISVTFSIPIAIAYRVEIERSKKIFPDNTVREIEYPFCNTGNLDAYKFQQYRYYLAFFQYFIPLGVISFVYIQMAIRLWGSKTPGNAQSSRDITLLRNKKRVIKMLIIVVLLFGLCWFPLQFYNILHVTWEDVNAFKYINIVWFCCDWLAMSNSCYNPFIYGIYNEKFQRELRRRFPFCRLRNGDGTDRNVSMYTRASSIRSTYTASTSKSKCSIPQPATGRNNTQQQYKSININGTGARATNNSNNWTIKSVVTNEQTEEWQDIESVRFAKTYSKNENHSTYSATYSQNRCCDVKKVPEFEGDDLS